MRKLSKTTVIVKKKETVNIKRIISFHKGMIEYRAQVFRLHPPGTSGSGAFV